MGLDVGQPRTRVAPRVNVTPLVDVVLVLLIIFMVVTPLLTKKLWLNIPKSEETTEEEPPDAAKPVVITFHRDGSVKINGQPVGLDELGARLERIMAARGDNLVFFDAEDDADYGDAIQVLDRTRGAGAQIAVLTESVL
ncbi:MAG TPA: biopolymer transporter ExbD [Haliangiales bacterium]|nr:biopolymer transporter ExbD [Haliangiales bacterium]